MPFLINLSLWEAVSPYSAWHWRVNQVVEQVTKSGTWRGPFYLFLWAVSCGLTWEGPALTESRRQPHVVISERNEMGFSFRSRLWQNNPGAARSTVPLSEYCQPRRADPLHATMCEVPIEVHKLSKLSVLWGMANRELQSFEKSWISWWLSKPNFRIFWRWFVSAQGVHFTRHWEKLQLLNLILACYNFTVRFPFFLAATDVRDPNMLGIWDGGTWETMRKPWG